MPPDPLRGDEIAGSTAHLVSVASRLEASGFEERGRLAKIGDFRFDTYASPAPFPGTLALPEMSLSGFSRLPSLSIEIVITISFPVSEVSVEGPGSGSRQAGSPKAAHFFPSAFSEGEYRWAPFRAVAQMADTSSLLGSSADFGSTVGLISADAGTGVAGPTSSAPRGDPLGTPAGPRAADLVGFLLGTGSGADFAKTLSRLDSFLVRGTDGRDALFESDRDEDSAGRLDFLLGSDPRDPLVEQAAPDGARPQRDIADLLPMQKRILAVVATLFSPRNATPADTREGTPPNQVSDAARETADLAIPPRAQSALIDFVAGLRPTPIPERIAELPPALPPALDSSDLPSMDGPGDGESASESGASGEGDSGEGDSGAE
jgi:hypothetical protein